MNLSDFQIGREFIVDGESRWRCTDVGSRVVVAIRIDRYVLKTVEYRQAPYHHMELYKETVEHLTGEEAEARGCFKGPPYECAETVFDENDLECCEPAD